jgi:HEPN domain-containing protein
VSNDLQRQLDIATAYFLAGERCSMEMRFGVYGFHSIGSPTITNYAFSVELALKIIHVLSRQAEIRGHDLKDLLDELPAEVRSNLPHLVECAGEIARYFEDWRYAYEHDFLVAAESEPRRAFIECYREIRRLRPDLRSVYEKLWGTFDPEWIQPGYDDGPRWELRLVRT